MLGELAQMAMVVSRAHAAAAVAAAHAVEVILADEHWQPETGRARALAGAKDAAESFRKVSRALRLTLMLEKTVAEAVRDICAGIIAVTAPPKDAGRAPVFLETTPDRRGPAGSGRGDRESDVERPDRDTERLVDIERPDILPRAPFRETVDRIGADLGAGVDWNAWTVARPEPTDDTPLPGPPVDPYNFHVPDRRLTREQNKNNYAAQPRESG